MVDLKILVISLCFLLFGCKYNKDNSKSLSPNTNLHSSLHTKGISASFPKSKTAPTPFLWESAHVYFLLTDRFQNGDLTNDNALQRNTKTAKLRGFLGGDLQGILQKLEEGYFTDLGVQAIWFTPVFEQIHGSVDEGTGDTTAYHGYWIKDWTAIDPNFGTHEDLKNVVQKAHQLGIRVLLDVVMNHTGPITKQDPSWGDLWVRTKPRCTYTNYDTAVRCTLVDNLPDIKTEKDQDTPLPGSLVAKWKKEGRFQKEKEALDRFFAKTGLKKSPKNYIIKWLTDYVRKLGIDGYRVDTVKHVEASAWKTLRRFAQQAFMDWKSKHPSEVLDGHDFFMLGELYGYGIDHKRHYPFSDKKVDYFANGFDQLLNFHFKNDAKQLGYEALFFKYEKCLKLNLQGKSILNYISSHDDMQPFDQDRKKPYEAANKLLLTPGAAQTYYGDELARPLRIKGAKGDATLRSLMQWNDTVIPAKQAIWKHWQKLGKFRKNHPAIGSGDHQMLHASPYIFTRILERNNFSDRVLVGLDLPKGKKTIAVDAIFENHTKLFDFYSGKEVLVKEGTVSFSSEYATVLLESKI